MRDDLQTVVEDTLSGRLVARSDFVPLEAMLNRPGLRRRSYLAQLGGKRLLDVIFLSIYLALIYDALQSM